MKTLYLLRHAKSSWHDPAMDDYDRPLNPRGLRAAPAIGTYMEEHGYRPAVILCSSARRTLETMSLVKPHLGLDVPTLIEDMLYLAPATTILSRAQEIDDTYDSAMIIAHNPGLEDAIYLLADTSSPTPIPDALPTAGLAVLRFQSDRWDDLKEGTGALIDFTTPKMEQAS